MSNEKRFPEILKRMPPYRFVPLHEIDWRKEFYLSRFINKLQKSNRVRIKEFRLKNLILHGRDLDSIFSDIDLIVSRINEDGVRIIRMEELYSISLSRRWTDSEAEEMEKLDVVVKLFDLDVKSLLMFIIIFMDKLARFLSRTINKREKSLHDKNFFLFKKDLVELRGEEVEKLSQMINDNTGWFEDVKNWRDDFVVHHPGAASAMIFRNGETYAALTTRKKISKEPKYIIMDSQATDIPIEELDRILFQLKKLLRVLDEYLCSHINILPVELK